MKSRRPRIGFTKLSRTAAPGGPRPKRLNGRLSAPPADSAARAEAPRQPAGRHRDSMLEAMGKSALRAMGSQIAAPSCAASWAGFLGGKR